MKISNALLTMFAVFTKPDGTIGRAKKKTIGYTPHKEIKFVESLHKDGNTDVYVGVRIGRIKKGELNQLTVQDTFIAT